MKINKFIPFLCLCLFAGFWGNAQSVVGVWELHAIDFEMTEPMRDEEFGEGDGFTSTDEATEIPETITFNEDGTCTLLFLAYYAEEEEEEDDTYIDDDDELMMSGIEISGTWEIVNGNNIKITEESGVEWYLTDIDMDEEAGFFTCGFSLLGFTWGIEMLEYGANN
jgi:hypothetical protein